MESIPKEIIVHSNSENYIASHVKFTLCDEVQKRTKRGLFEDNLF